MQRPSASASRSPAGCGRLPLLLRIAPPRRSACPPSSGSLVSVELRATYGLQTKTRRKCGWIRNSFSQGHSGSSTMMC